MIYAVDFLVTSFTKLFSNSVYKQQPSSGKELTNKINDLTLKISKRNTNSENNQLQSNTKSNEDIVREVFF